MAYLFWSVVVLILILCAGIFSNYGNKISNDKNFQTYFGWYIGILIANLFNILINLIFHFFMKDIEGKRGLKGEPGKKGLEGKSYMGLTAKQLLPNPICNFQFFDCHIGVWI